MRKSFKSLYQQIGKLEESEIFYRHLVGLTPEAVVIHSEGKIVFINPAALKLIGAKKEKEVMGQPVMKFIHPDSLALIQGRIKNMLSKQKVAPSVEEKFISLQGKIFFAETKAVPFTYQGKQAILAILHDITERKKQEERRKYLTHITELLSSSIDYKTTLGNISKGIVPSLADYTRIVLVDENKKISEIFSYHKSSKRVKEVAKLYNAYKSSNRPQYGVSHIISTGKSELIRHVTPQMANQSKRSKEVKKIISGLGLTSYMGVPLKIQSNIIGALILSSIREDRIYTKDDLKFAEEIAHRIANAIENARLYERAKKNIEIEERLAAIVSSSEDAIVSQTLDGTITSWNKSAEKMFGYTAEEAISKSIAIIIPKELWEKEKKIISQIKKGKHMEHYETVRLKKDGQSLHVALTISAIKNSEGKMIGISRIARDISERKKVENDLAHLASLVESSSDAIWSRTLDHKILSWNKGAEKLYGYKTKEVIGKSIDFLVIPDDRKEELDVITAKVLHGKQIQSFDTVRITKEGNRLDVSMTISPLKDAQGKIIGISAIVRNITEQKEQEKLKDEFISMASHELKTPITSMKMFLDLLENSLNMAHKDGDIMFVKRIKEQANRIRDLVNDLLDISRIGAGKLRFNIEAFQLEDLLKDTIEAIQPASRKHRLIYKDSIALPVNADRFRIYQVVTNLINNAIKYSPQSDKIYIATSKSQGKAIVSIQDFGIGIAKDKQTKIFEKLYQVTDPQVKTFPGLGMGLYISSEIIKRHDGEMWVKSHKGKGSTFYFSLPLQ